MIYSKKEMIWSYKTLLNVSVQMGDRSIMLSRTKDAESILKWAFSLVKRKQKFLLLVFSNIPKSCSENFYLTLLSSKPKVIETLSFGASHTHFMKIQFARSRTNTMQKTFFFFSFLHTIQLEVNRERNMVTTLIVLDI